jgi:hypothetical protein
VVDAADVRALPVEHADLIGFEPGLVQPAGDRVDLHAERRHRERVDDVLRGHVDFDHLADGDHHLVIGGDEARLAGLKVLVLDIERIERKAALGFRIAVVPVPLRGRYLHRQVGRGNDELLREQPERRHRDDHQHERRRDRPGEFEQAVMRPPRGHGLAVSLKRHTI